MGRILIGCFILSNSNNAPLVNSDWLIYFVKVMLRLARALPKTNIMLPWRISNLEMLLSIVRLCFKNSYPPTSSVLSAKKQRYFGFPDNFKLSMSHPSGLTNVFSNLVF